MASLAYKKYITIDDPRHTLLPELPFQRGQRVEVVIIAEDDSIKKVEKLKELLKTTQALPQAQALSETDIQAEIAAYRTEKH